MAAQENTKLVLGLFGATGVILISYLLFKKFGIKDKATPNPNQNQSFCDQSVREAASPCSSSPLSLDLAETAQENIENILSVPQMPLTDSSDEKGNPLIDEDLAAEEDTIIEGQYDDDQDVNKTSFIVIEGTEDTGLPDNDGVKKCDRSSDESSYDVVEEDQMIEDVEENEGGYGGEKNATGDQEKEREEAISMEKQSDQESFFDANEMSLVLVDDSDKSAVEVSSASFYSSADELVLVSQSKGQSTDREIMDIGEKKRGEEDIDKLLIEQDTTLNAGEKRICVESESVLSLACENMKGDGQDSSVVECSSQQEASYNLEEDSSSELGKAEQSQVLSAVLDESSEVQGQSGTLSVTEAVVRAKISATEVLSLDEDSEFRGELTSTEITEVLSKCQTSPGTLNRSDINKLASLLGKQISGLHEAVLDSLVRVTAFTQYMPQLRANGSPQLISKQILQTSESVVRGEFKSEGTMQILCSILTNLSMDSKIRLLMEDTVPALSGLLLLDSVSEAVLQSVLRPLIHFASEALYHKHFISLVQRLYGLVDSGLDSVQALSLKLLVNLSLSSEMVPHLLAAKAPHCLLELLDKPTADNIILRTVIVLENMEQCMQEGNMMESSLLAMEKAESTRTMYMTLRGVNSIPLLREKVYLLTQHDDEDIRLEASKLYKCITSTFK